MNARRQNYPPADAPRPKGSAPESFVATMGHHRAPVPLETPAPPADVGSGGPIARAEYRARVGNKVPPEHAVRAAGEVVCGRHKVDITLVAGVRPAIGFAIDYPLAKKPFRFFILPGEARALADLLTKAADELGNGGSQ